MRTLSFTPVFWYWLFGLMFLFLPVELWAAISQKGKGGTFSEFVWWAFGIKPRPDGQLVRFAGGRHVVLTGMCLALFAHFRFGFSVIPVAGFGVLVGVILLRALLWERPPRRPPKPRTPLLAR